MTRGNLLADTAPADSWEDAFPLGNGRHGALPYGRPGAERVVVTHHRLTWPDAAAPDGPPDLAGRLGEVRDLLLAGESHRALGLFGGDWPRYHPRPFHPAFAVNLTEDSQATGRIPATGGIPNGFSLRGYRRTLIYRAGVAVARWHNGWHDNGYGRRHACFVSRVRDLVVLHVRGTDPWNQGPFAVAVTVDPRLPGAPEAMRVTWELHQLAADDGVILATVEYPSPAPPGNGYVGAVRVTAISRPDHRIAAVVGPQWHGIRVSGCRELILLARVELFDDAAGKAAARDRALAAVTAAPASEPKLLLAEHTRAHAAAFGDAALDLGAPRIDRRLPVSPLLDRQAAQPDTPLPALLEKLFDSGRYLLLSASGPLPPRLTGLWQGDWNPAWSGAITTDANLGLQLAGAVTTGVPAAVDAVANLVREQLDDWRVNARRLFGTRGIVAPAHTDGVSGLATHFEPRWPLHTWTAAADWLLVPLLDEALARAEPGYATARAGEALLELAAFYAEFLVREDADGHVVFAPSYSPENAPAGWAPAAVNATMDIAAARHALRAATRAEGATQQAVMEWEKLIGRLPGYRLTTDGALAEWAWPPEGSGAPPLPGDDGHRHVSHLYPVWPLHEITVAGTPELASAALRALRLRGAEDDSAHGYLQKALAAARLRDAGLAGRLLAALTGQAFFFRSLMSSHYPKRSVYNADAACALPGVLAEMLVDSFPGDETCPSRIELLPAVPAFLPSGRLRGIRTLAGARVAELRWDTATRRAEAVLVSAAGGEADVSCWGPASRRRVKLPPGSPVRMSWESDMEVGDGDTR
jgi:alpha-L-fucosidase 2